tara:strand:+ start:2110 stop:3939 length:1830 start_codon:yes stop_codon:yes gene_type:complete
MYQTGLQTYYCVRGQSALEAYHLYLRLCKSVMGNSAGPRWHDIQHSNFDWRWTIKNLRNRKLLDDGTFHFNINLMNMKADILLLLLKKNMIENFDQHTGWKRIANDTPLLYNGVQPTIDVLKFKITGSYDRVNADENLNDKKWFAQVIGLNKDLQVGFHPEDVEKIAKIKVKRIDWLKNEGKFIPGKSQFKMDELEKAAVTLETLKSENYFENRKNIVDKRMKHPKNVNALPSLNSIELPVTSAIVQNVNSTTIDDTVVLKSYEDMIKENRNYAAKLRKRKQRLKEKETGSKVDRKRTKSKTNKTGSNVNRMGTKTKTNTSIRKSPRKRFKRTRLPPASDNNYANGPANAITLSTYTTAVNANERSCTFKIRQSYYWNVLFIEKQHGLQCSRHALKCLLLPYVNFSSDNWGDNMDWSNLEVLELVEGAQRMLPILTFRHSWLERFTNNDNTLLQFFSADGSNMWVDAYSDKFIGFICYEFGQPGHYTTLRPYYLHNGGWKWFYLDSYTKRNFERDEYNFNFKVLKELTPKECLIKYRTFFTENIEAGNRMIAFSIPSDTATEEYHGQVQLNYRAAGAKNGTLLRTKKLRNRGRRFNPNKGTVDVDMYND